MAGGTINFSQSASSGSYVDGRIVWRSVSDNNANNSDVTASIYVRKGHTDMTLTVATSGTWTYSLTVGGSTSEGTCSAAVLEEWVLLYTKTVNNIAHNADGSKSIKISGSVTAPSATSFAGHSTSGSGTAKLDDIPRASGVSAPDGTIGSAVKISISRASASFTHTLEYSFSGTTGTISSKTEEKSISWTPPLNLCSQIPNAPNAECTITCKTYSGNTLVGTKTCKINLTVPSSIKLACSPGWAAASPYNTGTAAGNIAAFVKGYSRAEVTFDSAKISAEGAYGAEIASFKIVYNGTACTQSPYRTELLKSAGEKTVTCYVYDTRGRYVSADINFNVYDYTKPTLKEISAYRCSSSGTADSDGMYISVSAEAVFSGIGGQNSAELKTRYKAAGGEYGEYTALASGVPSVIGSGAVLLTASYITEIMLTDALGNTSSCTLNIPTAEIAFHIREGGKGVAFFKYAEEDGVLDIAGDVKAESLETTGKIKAPNVSDTGWIDLPLADGVTVGSSAADGRYPGCAYRVINGNHVFIEFNIALTYEGELININASAIPSAYCPELQSIHALIPSNGRTVTRVYVTPGGILRLEWVQQMIATANTTSYTVTWTSGTIDYFINA